MGYHSQTLYHFGDGHFGDGHFGDGHFGDGYIGCFKFSSCYARTKLNEP